LSPGARVFTVPPVARLLRNHRFASVGAGAPGPQLAVHDTIELTLVTRGAEWVSFDDDAPAQAARSALIVVPPRVVHSSFTKQVGVDFFCLHLDAQHAATVLDELALDVLDAPHTRLASPGLCAAFRRLEAAKAQSVLAADDGSVAVLDALAQMVVTKQRRDELPNRRRLERVEAWVRAHLDEAHTVPSLAKVAGLSPFHFLRTFRQYFGCTPHQFVLERRLERARELMRGELRLTDIAHEVGFSSSSRLTEAFTRRFGETPSAFRASQRVTSSLNTSTPMANATKPLAVGTTRTLLTAVPNETRSQVAPPFVV
jgi:AraC-like DNA-binding protein